MAPLKPNKPATIEVVKKLADTLDATVGYLLGESQDQNILKDPSMLKRHNDIIYFPSKDRENILHTLDGIVS